MLISFLGKPQRRHVLSSWLQLFFLSHSTFLPTLSVSPVPLHNQLSFSSPEKMADISCANDTAVLAVPTTSPQVGRMLRVVIFHLPAFSHGRLPLRRLAWLVVFFSLNNLASSLIRFVVIRFSLLPPLAASTAGQVAHSTLPREASTDAATLVALFMWLVAVVAVVNVVALVAVWLLLWLLLRLL